MTEPTLDLRRAFFVGLTTVTLAVLVGLIWSGRVKYGPNDGSRWDTVWSLVEHGTYHITDTPAEAEQFSRALQYKTIDKVTVDGKTYSSKPPLLPTAMAGWVWACKQVVGLPFSIREGKVRGSIEIYARLTLWLFNVAPFGLMLLHYRWYLDRYAGSDLAYYGGLTACAWATLATGYSVTLNNHTIAACFGMVTAYHLIAVWHEGRREWWRFALLGLVAAWTATNELPALTLLGIASLAVLLADPLKALTAYAAPALIVAGAFFYCNWLVVGNLKPAYLQKDLYANSYWDSDDKSGIDALNDDPEPYWLYFTNMTVGHHGIWSLSPVFAFSVWGCWLLWRRRQLPWVASLVFLVTAVVFAFFWLVSDQRNYGGSCHGMRWLLWLQPLWLLCLHPALDRVAGWTGGRRKAALWLFVAALAVSAVSTADTWANPWGKSWLHRIYLYQGWIDY